MDDAVDFVFCLNAVTENATTNFLCLGQNILVCDVIVCDIYYYIYIILRNVLL